MRLAVYRTINPRDLPDALFWEMGGLDDRFISASTAAPSDPIYLAPGA